MLATLICRYSLHLLLHHICPILIICPLTLIYLPTYFVGVQAAQMMALKKELAKLKSAQGFKPYIDMPGKKGAEGGGVGKGKPPPT